MMMMRISGHYNDTDNVWMKIINSRSMRSHLLVLALQKIADQLKPANKRPFHHSGCDFDDDKDSNEDEDTDDDRDDDDWLDDDTNDDDDDDWPPDHVA